LNQSQASLTNGYHQNGHGNDWATAHTSRGGTRNRGRGGNRGGSRPNNFSHNYNTVDEHNSDIRHDNGNNGTANGDYKKGDTSSNNRGRGAGNKTRRPNRPNRNVSKTNTPTAD